MGDEIGMELCAPLMGARAAVSSRVVQPAQIGVNLEKFLQGWLSSDAHFRTALKLKQPGDADQSTDAEMIATVLADINGTDEAVRAQPVCSGDEDHGKPLAVRLTFQEAWGGTVTESFQQECDALFVCLTCCHAASQRGTFAIAPPFGGAFGSGGIENGQACDWTPEDVGVCDTLPGAQVVRAETMGMPMLIMEVGAHHWAFQPRCLLRAHCRRSGLIAVAVACILFLALGKMRKGFREQYCKLKEGSMTYFPGQATQDMMVSAAPAHLCLLLMLLLLVISCATAVQAPVTTSAGDCPNDNVSWTMVCSEVVLWLIVLLLIVLLKTFEAIRQHRCRVAILSEACAHVGEGVHTAVFLVGLMLLPPCTASCGCPATHPICFNTVCYNVQLLPSDTCSGICSRDYTAPPPYPPHPSPPLPPKDPPLNPPPPPPPVCMCPAEHPFCWPVDKYCYTSATSNDYSNTCAGACDLHYVAAPPPPGPPLLPPSPQPPPGPPIKPPQPPSPPAEPPWLPPPPSPPGYVSNQGQLQDALMDSTLSIIWLAPGIYFLLTIMCDNSALCIDRDLTIQAIIPGSVVLDADAVSSRARRRVIKISGTATVNLIGLNITGGYAVRTAKPQLHMI